MSNSPTINNARIRQIISLIDLTNLSDDCNRESIDALCTQAYTPAGAVAAICIWPRHVCMAKQAFNEQSANVPPMPIATVVNFPGGDETTKAINETIEFSLADGATEIDYVLPYRELISGNLAQVATAVKAVRKLVPSNALLKVILETGKLESRPLIASAATIAIDEGADFIKTSTGKTNVNATPEAASVMLEALAQSGANAGFKAAGGIRTVEDADIYLKLAEERFGASWVNASNFRFGASGLLQDALTNLEIKDSDTTSDVSDY
jgi:deoxyribose-phosphate aldolase